MRWQLPTQMTSQTQHAMLHPQEGQEALLRSQLAYLQQQLRLPHDESELKEILLSPLNSSNNSGVCTPTRVPNIDLTGPSLSPLTPQAPLIEQIRAASSPGTSDATIAPAAAAADPEDSAAAAAHGLPAAPSDASPAPSLSDAFADTQPYSPGPLDAKGDDEQRKKKVATARARRATISPAHRSMQADANSKDAMDESAKEPAKRPLTPTAEEPSAEATDPEDLAVADLEDECKPVEPKKPKTESPPTGGDGGNQDQADASNQVFRVASVAAEQG